MASEPNDTLNIAGVESAHRVVFTTNSGSGTMLGAVRDHDIINGSVIDQRPILLAAPAAAAAVASGASDGLDALVHSALRGPLPDPSSGVPRLRPGAGPGRGNRTGPC